MSGTIVTLKTAWKRFLTPFPPRRVPDTEDCDKDSFASPFHREKHWQSQWHPAFFALRRLVAAFFRGWNNARQGEKACRVGRAERRPTILIFLPHRGCLPCCSTRPEFSAWGYPRPASPPRLRPARPVLLRRTSYRGAEPARKLKNWATDGRRQWEKRRKAKRRVPRWGTHHFGWAHATRTGNLPRTPSAFACLGPAGK